MKKLCPVCDLELSEPLSFCAQCAWDLKNDITLNISIGHLPAGVVEEYKRWLFIARKNWQEKQKLGIDKQEMEERLARLETMLEQLANQASTESQRNRPIKECENNDHKESEFGLYDVFKLYVHDTITNLAWTRNANLSSVKITYVEAKEFIRNMNREHYAGFDDWRIPTLDEIISLQIETEDLGTYDVWTETDDWDKESRSRHKILKTYNFKTLTEKYNYLGHLTFDRRSLIQIGFRNIQIDSYYIVDGQGRAVDIKISDDMLQRGFSIGLEHYLWPVRGDMN